MLPVFYQGSNSCLAHIPVLHPDLNRNESKWIKEFRGKQETNTRGESIICDNNMGDTILFIIWTLPTSIMDLKWLKISTWTG